MNWDIARTTFDALVASYEADSALLEGASFDAVVNPIEADESEPLLVKARKYSRRLGTDLASASQGHAFVNGKHFEMNDVSANSTTTNS